MIWGYAGVFPGAFGVSKQAPDFPANKLRWVAEHGFKCTGVSLEELREPARREQLASLCRDLGLSLTVRPRIRSFDPEATPDALKRAVDESLELIRVASDVIDIPLVTVGAGPVHRFMASPSLPEQMDRLAMVLTPLAQGCDEQGKPIGIENHGDYYCSDLVGLCRRVPHLGIFLDTGNTYLAGEQSVPACREAAPYVVGTHFKDHVVFPDPKTLTFNIKGAVLGQGHVGLREIYDDLLKLNPNPDKLVMEWELVPPKDMDPYDALKQSWDFVRSLPAPPAGH